MTPNILSILIWLPVLGGILILSTGGDRNAQLARKIALGFSVGTFLLSLSIYADFDINTASMQFVERYKWIETLHIQYFLGVDGISMPLIILTTLLTIIVVIAGWEVITKRVAQYMAVLGGHADTDVPDYRGLGRFKPGLCGYKVFSVYAGWISTDACGDCLFVFRIRSHL